MNTLILTKEDAQDAVYGDNEDWVEVKNSRTIDDNSRWSIYESAIFQHLTDNKFYRFFWSKGATEGQDERPYEYDDEVEVYEVVQKEVTRLEWVEAE